MPYRIKVIIIIVVIIVNSGYRVAIPTYLLPGFNLSKMKSAFRVAPESDRLSCVCAMQSSYSLTPTE